MPPSGGGLTARLPDLCRPPAVVTRQIRSGAWLSRAVSVVSRPSFCERDWPLPHDHWRSGPDTEAAGQSAHPAWREAPARASYIFQAGAAQEPSPGDCDVAQTALTTRIAMVIGLERSKEDLLLAQGPGVAAGLRDLAVVPGDAVAEQQPATPGLAVRFALEGAQTYVVMAHPARLAEVKDELDRYRDGRCLGVRSMTLDFKRRWPESHYTEGARTVAEHLSVLRGLDFSALPDGIRFKALISRGVFEYMDLPRIAATLRSAGQVLHPGGGLVFEFPHAASQLLVTRGQVTLSRIGFHQIEGPLRDAGLRLRSLFVTFRDAHQSATCLIATRRVLPDADGAIDLHKADAAAWSGWDEIVQQRESQDRPVRIEVSGLFVKQGQTKD